MLESNNETYAETLHLTAKYGLINSTILGAYMLAKEQSKNAESAIRNANRYLNALEKMGFLRSKRLRDSKCFELTESGFLYASDHFDVLGLKGTLPFDRLDNGMLPSVAHKTFAAGILECMRQKTGEKYVSTCWSEREMRLKFGRVEALKATKNKEAIKLAAITEMRFAGIPDGLFGVQSEFSDNENEHFEDTFLIEIERSRIRSPVRMSHRLDSFIRNARRRLAKPGMQSCRGIFVVANEKNVFADYKRAIATEFPNGDIVEDYKMHPVSGTGHIYKDVSPQLRIYLLNASVFEYRMGVRNKRFDTLQDDFWVPLVLVKADFSKNWLEQIYKLSTAFLLVIKQIQAFEDPIDSALNPEV